MHSSQRSFVLMRSMPVRRSRSFLQMLERWQRQLPQSYPSLYRRLPVSSTNLQAHSFRAFSSTPKGQQGEEKTTGDQTKAPSRQSVLDRLIGRYIDAPAGTGVPEQYASFSELWSILSPEKRRLQAALAALGLSSTVTLSFPFLAGRVVDLFGSQEAGLQFVAEQTMLSGGIVILGAAASFCRLYLLETSIERVAFRLRKELFEKLMREDAGFFDKTLTGEIVNRLSGDITLTSRVLFEASAGIRASLNAVIGTGLLFSLAPSHLFGTLLAPVSAIFILGFVYGRLMRQIANARQEALARSMQHAEERISNIKTVRLLNGERLEMETFEKMIDGVYGLSQKNALATAGRVGIFYAAGGLFLLPDLPLRGDDLRRHGLPWQHDVSGSVHSHHGGGFPRGPHSVWGRSESSGFLPQGNEHLESGPFCALPTICSPRRHNSSGRDRSRGTGRRGNAAGPSSDRDRFV